LNPRYRATARRHWLLFVLLVLLCALIGVTFSLGSPKLYRSSATLFAESATPESQAAFGALPPAAQEQSMLTELLSTNNFVHDIARNSPLQAYLETHTSTGWTPTALLKRFLKGPPTLDDRVATALGPKRVTSTVVQQHILEVSLDAPEPLLAQQTLRALIKEYLRQRATLAQGSLQSARRQVNAAANALTKARTNLSDYLRTHPGLPPSDPEQQALTTAYHNALVTLNGTTSSLNQALSALSGGTGLQSTLRVFDSPKLPLGPTTGKKKVVETAFAGAFVGGLLSFLLIMLLSRSAPDQAVPAAPATTLHGPSENGDGLAVPEHDRPAELQEAHEGHSGEIRRE